MLTLAARYEFHTIIQPMLDGFWVVFIQQLDSKLNNPKSTCLTYLKFSDEMYSIFARTFV